MVPVVHAFNFCEAVEGRTADESLVVAIDRVARSLTSRQLLAARDSLRELAMRLEAIEASR